MGSKPTVDVGVVPLRIILPDREVGTGFGVRWPDQAHDLAYYENLGRAAGFAVASSRVKDQWLFLEPRRP